MEKAKKIVLGFLVIAILVLAGLYGFYLYKSNKSEASYGNILFYRFDCPHCKIVQEFIEANNITSKLSYSHLEISKPVNQNLIIKIGKDCNIAEKELGVPLYYDSKEKKCYLGDTPIIDHFKLLLNIS
jgi:hypothetical protein